ncbi:MAG: tripartite tricarboxylate transporter permease [Thermodesulfobacteriota bacterium]
MLLEIFRSFGSAQPMDYLIMALGVVIGSIVGFLPGLGASQAMALLLPLTYGMDPIRAILLLMSVAGSAPAGGSIAAILINTPGEPLNVATCWDGYPLARQGKAGLALGTAATASFGGALVGLVVLIAILPLGKRVVLSFSYPEIFTIALGGLVCLILIEQERLWKGFISLALGMVIVSIGYDPVTGGIRHTFGTMYLWEGIKVVPALVGLFAIGEGIKLVVEDRDKAAGAEKLVSKASYRDILQGIKAVFKHFWLFLQSAVIGAVVGIAPAIGGGVGNVLSYSVAAQTVKDNPHFGKGDIRGVIASESANNSKGGDLVPTVLFGIPGSITCAILLGALMLHGIQPGPRLIIDKPGIIYGLIIAVFLSSIVISCFILLGAPYLSSIPNIPDNILGTIVIILGVLGGYATELDFMDAIVAMIFGLMGYFFTDFGYSKVAVVMALVLGKVMQVNFFLTLDTMGPPGFFVRPIPLIIIILCVFLIIRAIFRRKKRSEGEELFR